MHKKEKSKEEIAWMIANEYYEHLIAKKNGKVIRKQCFDATDQFMIAMASLRGHM